MKSKFNLLITAISIFTLFSCKNDKLKLELTIVDDSFNVYLKKTEIQNHVTENDKYGEKVTETTINELSTTDSSNLKYIYNQAIKSNIKTSEPIYTTDSSGSYNLKFINKNLEMISIKFSRDFSYVILTDEIANESFYAEYNSFDVFDELKFQIISTFASKLDNEKTVKITFNEYK